MATDVEHLTWHGCYDDSWKGFIVPDAFAHPAKFARGLITRIYTHMLAQGMLNRGDSVVDPFGGIGTGGIIAASYGLAWYGCELEAKFHALAQQNFGLHMHTWMQFDDPAPTLVCGDSRKLRVNLAGVLPQAVVASPPFTGGTDTQGRGEKLLVDASAKHRHKTRLIQGSAKEYGNTPGQLDGLPAGDVNAVISSPPFLGARSGTTASSPPAAGGPCAERINTVADGDRYGDTEGQLSAMAVGDVDAVVGSPPFAANGSNEGHTSKRNFQYTGEHNYTGNRCSVTRYECPDSPGQLGAMPSGSVESIVTSPPYEGSFSGGDKVESADLEADMRRRGCSEASIKKAVGNGHTGGLGYGVSGGQLGNATGETFWHAARDIVSECYAILKPGGWSAWVCKDFVRNKARVPFCDDWCKLLESQGFIVTTRVHAMLVKETREPDLFGGDDHVTTTERKSFFRRLAEKKGSPRIDFEEVIFAVKQGS